MIACVGAMVPSASAAVIVWDYTFEYSEAAAPVGPVPWLRATIDDEGTAGSVNVTLQGINLTNQEFITRWLFNLELDASTFASISVGSTSQIGDFDATIGIGHNAFRGGGAGRFDLSIAFADAPPEMRFMAGDAFSFTLVGGGIEAHHFLSLSTGPAHQLYTAAQVRGIDPGADLSGWVTIPEPSGLLPSMMLAGAALAGRRRR